MTSSSDSAFGQAPASVGVAHLLRTLGEACRVCRHVQRRLEAVRSMTKDDASPVTIADFAAQAVVARGLLSRGMLAGGLVAEESAGFLKTSEHKPHVEACVAALKESSAWEDCTADEMIEMVDLGSADPAGLRTAVGGWTLDPVDGTKGFLRGQQYCTSLCLIQNGKPTLGFLACPNLSADSDEPMDEPRESGTIFFARSVCRDGSERSRLGEMMAGVYMVEEARLEAEPMRVVRREFDPAQSARLAESVESGHTNHSASWEVMKRACGDRRLGDPIKLDSQVKYAVIARDQADVYLRLPSKRGYVERIWDHAAGTLIAGEAGCVVSDAMGRSLDFSRGRGLEGNQGIVAAPAGLHERLIRAVEELTPPGV